MSEKQLDDINRLYVRDTGVNFMEMFNYCVKQEKSAKNALDYLDRCGHCPYLSSCELCIPYEVTFLTEVYGFEDD